MPVNINRTHKYINTQARFKISKYMKVSGEMRYIDILDFDDPIEKL